MRLTPLAAASWLLADTDSDDVDDGVEIHLGRNPNVAGSVEDTSGAVALNVFTPLR